MNQYEIENATLDFLKECQFSDDLEGVVEKKILNAPFEIQLCLLKSVYLNKCASYFHEGLELVENKWLRELTLKDGDKFLRNVLEMEAEIYNENNIASYIGKFDTKILDVLLGEADDNLQKNLLNKLSTVNFKVFNEIIDEAKDEGDPLPYAVILDFLNRLKLVELNFMERSRDGIKESASNYLKGVWSDLSLRRDKDDFYKELSLEVKKFNDLKVESVNSDTYYYSRDGVTYLSTSLNNAINESYIHDKTRYHLLYVGLYQYYQENMPESLNEVLSFIGNNQKMSDYKILWQSLLNEDDVGSKLLSKSVQHSENGKYVEYNIDMLAWYNTYKFFEVGLPMKKNDQLIETLKLLKEEYLETVPREKIKYDETGAVIVDINWTQTITRNHKITWKKEVLAVFNNIFNEIQMDSENQIKAVIESDELEKTIRVKVSAKPGFIFKEDVLEKIMESILVEKRILKFTDYEFDEDIKTQALLNEYLSYVNLERTNSLKENVDRKAVIKRKF